jgi:hypothetical protein
MAAALGLVSGGLRHELVLILFGAVLLAVWVYSLLAIVFMLIIHRKRVLFLSVRLVPELSTRPRSKSPESLPEVLSAGQPGAVVCLRKYTRDGADEGDFTGKGRFFRLPGIVIRYRVDLSTKDGRRLSHIFDPDFLQNNTNPFTAPPRGAYYGEQDKLLIFDIIGLFQAAIAIPQPPGPRLLVMPHAAEQAVPPAIQSGGVEQRTEPHFLRTDDLIEHRPYVPGDDPRRINWKLYGHAGDLFVREGEPEPPPRSRLVILIDSQTDGGLYTAEAGRRGVDLLCENALALALDYTDRGMDVSIGYSGGGISNGMPAELAAALAYPAALPLFTQAALSGGDELPQADEARGVLIMALPRGWTDGDAAENGAAQPSLDRFLKKRNVKQTVDMLFLYGGEEVSPSLEESAETCVRFYSGKGGVRARHIRV